MLIHLIVKDAEGLSTLSLAVLAFLPVLCSGGGLLWLTAPGYSLSWWQRHETTGHIGYSVRKQGEMSPLVLAKTAGQVKRKKYLPQEAHVVSEQSLREQANAASLPVLSTPAMLYLGCKLSGPQMVRICSHRAHSKDPGCVSLVVCWGMVP